MVVFRETSITSLQFRTISPKCIKIDHMGRSHILLLFYSCFFVFQDGESFERPNFEPAGNSAYSRGKNLIRGHLECFRMCGNAGECTRMDENVRECLGMQENARECARMHRNQGGKAILQECILHPYFSRTSRYFTSTSLVLQVTSSVLHSYFTVFHSYSIRTSRYFVILHSWFILIPCASAVNK